MNAALVLALLIAAGHPWPHTQPVARTLGDLAVPEGFTRVALPKDSYGAWLRTLPLHAGNPPVHLFSGGERDFQDGHDAVLDLDVGRRDLQQCADAAIRLRAEWLWSRGRQAEACFHYTEGTAVPFSRWAKGDRPTVAGNKVGWKAGGRAGSGYADYRAWLDNVFIYAGTQSVALETRGVGALGDMMPGDVLVQGGSPGHAVTIGDVARAADGRVIFVLLQGHMPAQEVHLVRRPGHAWSPWYETTKAAELELPEWTFATPASLKRWPDVVCKAR